jgi:hypothetical protein
MFVFLRDPAPAAARSQHPAGALTLLPIASSDQTNLPAIRAAALVNAPCPCDTTLPYAAFALLGALLHLPSTSDHHPCVV